MSKTYIPIDLNASRTQEFCHEKSVVFLFTSLYNSFNFSIF